MRKMRDRLALHTWTLDTTPLGEVLRAAKAAGWNAVELRRVDFTRCFDAGMSNGQVLDLVRASGLEVACVGTEYGLIFAKGEEKKRLLKVLDETCANARALGFAVSLDEGSTDSNIPMNLGIPAITIDGGGRGTGSHALDEAFDPANSWQGSQRALLLAIALAQQ